MARLRWTKSTILKKLRGLHKEGKDLSYGKLSKTTQSLVSAAAYHFGSFRKAVEKAGIDYSEVTRRPRWNKPVIIRLIKAAKRAGEDLHWAAVTRRKDELGRAAFAALQKRLFGSWERALHAAGLDSDEISRYRSWDKNTIVFELRERHSNKQPLNSGAIQTSDPGLHAAAMRHFGSYDAAIRKAKLKPETIRKRREWDRASVLKALRAFKRKHKTLSDSTMRKSNPALYGAALREFKSIAKARAAVDRGA